MAESTRPGGTKWRLAYCVIGTAGFFLFDSLLLAALPALGLSFGPVWPPVIWLTFPRLLSLLAVGTPLAVRFLLGRKIPSHAGQNAFRIWLGLNLAFSVLALDALFVEPFRLTETILRLPGPSSAGGKPLRIVQLTDLHVEAFTRREREMLARVEALAPDLIVLTGDYVHLDLLHSSSALADTRGILSQLHAPLGIFAVQGTVDREEVLAEIFTGLPITLLRDETYFLPLKDSGGLFLIGIDNRTGKQEPQRLAQLAAEAPAGAFTILLYHTPDLIQEAASAGIDLYLAGHTHGGQIRLPFYGALVTFSKFGKQYEMGLYHAGSTDLYVSRGIGMEGLGLPQVRFLCPPEIVVIELASGKSR